uniref:Insulin-like domain-containing protein n=1 Tax=Oncorhynchus kisutch TaxID=8019 RepID=A0A8C7LF43_ONCKI
MFRDSANEQCYLCGTHLMDALYLVCGEKQYQMDMMVKRVILDLCCHNPCNVFHHE